MENLALKYKRIYELPEKEDGRRVLVDRLWPRGVRKADACVDVWLKDIAPSPDLRNWFCHDPEKFPAFEIAYQQELSNDEVHRQAVNQVVGWLEEGPVTLLFAAKDLQHNHVVVLHDFLASKIGMTRDAN